MDGTEKNHEEMMRAIGRLEGKIDGINQRLDSINGSIKGHETRINSLEINFSELRGRATILGAIGGFSMTVLWNLIKDRLFNKDI